MHRSWVARCGQLGCVLALAWPVCGFADSSGVAEMAEDSETAESHRVRTEFYGALSQQLRSQPEPRMQLAAAILVGHSVPRGGKGAAGEPFPAEAQALFAAVRQGSNHPLVLRFAATNCRFDVVVCDADGAMAQLLEMQPRNAENLILALHRAKVRGDASEVDRLFGVLAQADHFEGGYPEAWRWWWDVYRPKVNDPRLFTIAGFTAEQARDMTPSMLVGSLAFGHSLALPILGRGVLNQECEIKRVNSAGDARRSQCLKIAELLRDKGGSQIDQITGFPILWRLAADETERAMLESEWRQHQWTLSRVPILEPDAQSYLASELQWFEQLIESLKRAGTEIEAFAAARNAAGLRADPPAEYRPTQTLAQIDEVRQLAAAEQRSRLPATNAAADGGSP